MSSDDLLQRAAADIRAGRIQQAQWSLQKLLTRDPRNARALDMMSGLALAQGQPDRAAELLRHAITIDPQNFELHYNLGVCLAAARKTSAAIEAYERSLQLKPD